MTATPTPLGETLSLLLKEGKRRLGMLAALFSVIALVALPVGLQIPKRWDAYALILVQESNILRPLMEGRAVPTEVTNEGEILNQLMFSRRIMREVLEFGGWLGARPSVLEEEQLMDFLRRRIRIDNPRSELVRISYSDTDPQRSAKVTNKLAEIYIREGTSAKERESREAFDFIDKRVSEYAQKILASHEEVLAHYRAHHRPGLGAIGDPPRAGAGDGSNGDKRLAGAMVSSAAPSPALLLESRKSEEQLTSRTNQLQQELDQLLSNYTDQHPAVVRLRRDLNGVREELRRAKQTRMMREQAVAAVATAATDEVIRATRSESASGHRAAPGLATAPPSPAGTAAGAEVADAELKGVSQDTTLAELIRRYEATREVYQDLLNRRESARVSMDLDAERRGLTLRVQEAAEVPIVAGGLRLLHICLIGLIIAAAIPLGILFAIVQYDGRVRSESQLERLAKVRPLVKIPRGTTETEQRRERVRAAVALAMVAGVFAVYLATFLIRLKT